MKYLLVSHKVYIKFIFVLLLPFVFLFLFLDFFTSDKLYFLIYLLSSLALISIFTYKTFVYKLELIASQIANIISKKPYERLVQSSYDEFGLISYFINDLVYNFENVSSYLKAGQRMFSELTIAHEVQQNLIPSSVDKVTNYEFLVKHQPCDELGGDTFNFFNIGCDLYFYIGDATGHGAPAALIMIIVQTLFLSLKQNFSNLSDLIINLNSFLKLNTGNTMFLSSVFCNFKPNGELHYYGCGFEKILVYRQKEGVVQEYATKGLALGLVDGDNFKLTKNEFQLNDGDVVLFYTDGVTELKNSNMELFSLNRLIDCFSKYGHLESVDLIFSNIKNELENFALNSHQLDDITLSIVKFRPDNKLEQNDFSTKF